LELRVLSPTAILGYGFPLESLERGLRDEPDVIAVDAGSTDPGPYYLGEGVPFVPDPAVERDLYHLVKAALKVGVPLVVGSAGGAGARPHVESLLRILERVALRLGRRLRVAIVWADVDREWLIQKLREGVPVEPLEGFPRGSLTFEQVASSTRIVAQLGVEPIVEALRLDPHVVVAGRVVDAAPFAALPWLRGADRGLSIHMAKILECGAIAAEPGSGSDGMMGILRRSEFEIYPLNPRRRATKLSVAEHALYERTDPYREYVPGGYADLSSVVYEEAGDGRVVVRGARWVPLDRYMVKLEGVRLVGHRAIVVMGVRDPDTIARLDDLVAAVVEEARRLQPGGYRVYVHVYGRNAVLGSWEPTPKPAHEVAVIFEVVAGTREEALSVASRLRALMMHVGWPGRRTTAGNVALPFSPSELYVGRAYEWSIWHLVQLEHPLELGSIEEKVVG
jgi:hypothetical protein